MTSISIGLGLPQPPTVTVLGSAVVGGTLSLSPLSLDGAGPYSIAVQWLRDGAPISGATSATYTTVTEDIGTAISAELPINGTPIQSENSVTIEPVAVVPIAPAWTEQPFFTDPNPRIGDVLAVDPGTLTGDAPIDIAFEYLRLDGVDKTSETTGLSWDSGGEPIGIVTGRLRATNAAGPVLSDELTVTLSALSVGGTALSLTSFATKNPIFAPEVGDLNVAPAPFAGTTDAADGAVIEARTVAHFNMLRGESYTTIAEVQEHIRSGRDGGAPIQDYKKTGTQWAAEKGYTINSGPDGPTLVIPDTDLRIVFGVDFSDVVIIGTVRGYFAHCKVSGLDAFANSDATFFQCDVVEYRNADWWNIRGFTFKKRAGVSPGCRFILCDFYDYKADSAKIGYNDLLLFCRIDPNVGSPTDPMVWDSAPKAVGQLTVSATKDPRLTAKMFENTVPDNTLPPVFLDDPNNAVVGVVDANGHIPRDTHSDPVVKQDSGVPAQMLCCVINFDYLNRFHPEVLDGQVLGAGQGRNRMVWSQDKNELDPDWIVACCLFINRADDGKERGMIGMTPGSLFLQNRLTRVETTGSPKPFTNVGGASPAAPVFGCASGRSD